MEDKDRFAPEGAIWVCVACGKTAKDRYGIEEGMSQKGWDESCMLNSALCDESSLIRHPTYNRIVEADPFYKNELKGDNSG